MNFGWETKEERILRFMRILPQKKLEWLEESRRFALRSFTKKRKKIFWKMREIHRLGDVKC